MTTKRYLVVNAETQISHDAFETRAEAEKVAREMTEYHQRKYIVKERPPAPAPKDCLGRPIRSDITEPTRPLPRMLTDDQITAIAHEVRTRPLAEVGRHVMPLIQHIVVLDGRTCQNCRHWVAYNAGAGVASRGECLVYASPESPVDLQGDAPMAVLTPFDWSCKGWEQRASETSDAQSQSAS